MKTIKNVLIFLIIVNIVVLVYLLIKPKVKIYDYVSYAIAQEDSAKKDGNTNNSTNIKPKRDNILELENESVYNNYNGELIPRYVNLKIQDLIESGFKELYDATVGMGTDALSYYLERNKNDIGIKTGITEIEDFVKFIKKIQIYDNSNIKCEKAEIIENSYVNGNAYDNFKVQLTYDNGQVLLFDVFLSNRKNIDTPIIIIK